MPEPTLRDYRAATQPSVSSDFTARVFAQIGLDRYITTPAVLGDVFVAWTSSGVSAVRPAGDAASFESWYAERFGRACVPAVEDDAVSTRARANLRGEDVPVALDLHACSALEQQVLQKTAEIGHAVTRPYSWVAREIGRPGAAETVEAILSRNPVPLLVPCHRTIGADYSVGSYVLGTGAKRSLLQSEGIDFSAVEAVSRGGFRYVGCDDGMFCLLTCGDVATHLDDPGYVALHTIEEAHAHGLRPCGTCRPLAAA